MIITLQRYILRKIVLSFLPALLCFALIIEFVDLFSSINRYLLHGISGGEILRIFLLYLPKCISYSLSPALLFSATYTISGLYSSNELISILNAGISFRRFMIPVLLFGVLISFISILFLDTVVIGSYNEKMRFQNELLGIEESLNNSQFVVRVGTAEVTVLYYVRFYQAGKQEMQHVSILFLNEENSMKRRIDADRGVLTSDGWKLSGVRDYRFADSGEISVLYHETMFDEAVNVDPEYLEETSEDITLLSAKDARKLLERVRLVDYPTYLSQRTDYLERYSFAFTPLVVLLFSASVGWLFKKNVLLFSMLFSLALSVLYYVSEMVSVLFAKQGYLPPLAGAWLPLLGFTLFGLLLLRRVKS